MRAPVPADPAEPGQAQAGHGRAPHTGGTEAAQELAVGAHGTGEPDELALAGRGRRLHRDEGHHAGGDAPGG
eukprot:5329990-Alexandrium_andersonii.AAC.1